MKNILTLDCEFNQPSRKTVQIGAVICDVRSGDIIHRFNTFVNPLEPINPYITDLTGIKDSDVANAPMISDAYLMLKEVHHKYQCFVNPIVWGSGVRNDSSAIHEEYEQAIGESHTNFMGYRVIDAKTLYQSMRMFQNKKLKGGLKTACEELGIGFEGTNHNALDDAINTFRLWHHLMRKFYDGFKK